MSLANDITARLLIEIPKRYRNVRVWRQNTGGGIGMSTVKQALALMGIRHYAEAAVLLRSRPIKWGIEGCGDISGVIGPSGRRLEIEIKADKDCQSREQQAFELLMQSHGAVYLLGHDVEQCLDDLGRWV